MLTSVVHRLALVRHPESHGDAVRGIEARVSRSADALVIRYSIAGDLARLRVPASRPPRFVDGLWRHTCCECFVRLAGEPGYHEFNCSPSGEWAAYAFTDYREGVPMTAAALNPRIAVRAGDASLALDAVIPLSPLSAAHPRAPLALALSAVIECDNGVLAYWALRHPPGRPDFHHPGSFVFELEGA